MNELTRREFVKAAGVGAAMLGAARWLRAEEPGAAAGAGGTAAGPSGAGAASRGSAAASAPANVTGSGPSTQGGFFRAVQADGRWWLVDPRGEKFLSKGVTTVRFAQDNIMGTPISPYGLANRAKYGSEQAWREAAAKRLAGWGFNTLGAWSDEKLADVAVDGKHLAYAPTLDLGARFAAHQGREQAWLHGVFPDVFDPGFAKLAGQIARETCAPRRDDERLLGWFTDNELRWGADWRGADELLTMFLALPSEAPGRAAAVELLRQRYDMVQLFNKIWKTGFASWEDLLHAGAIAPPVVRKEIYNQNEEVERQANVADPARAALVADCDAFLALLAERYFRVTHEAIKAADPNHMNFGCRFAYLPAQPVVDAAAKFLDVISFNCYQTDPRNVIQRYSAFGRPLIIGEFSFRGADSGLPNTKGAGPVVQTQADRAADFERYVRWGLSDGHLVGYHWFEHADEPKEGRFDGENSNYGVVDIRDEPYELLTARMTAINAIAEELHSASR